MSLLLPPLEPPSSGGHASSRSVSPTDGTDHPTFLTNRVLPPLAVSLSSSQTTPTHFESPTLLGQQSGLSPPIPASTTVSTEELPDPIAPPEGLQEVKIFHNSRVDKRKLVWQEILENQYIRFSSTGKCLLLHVVLPKRASPVRMVIELFAQRPSVSRRGPNDTNVMRVASTRNDIPNVSTLKVTEHMQVETDNFCSKWCYVIKAPDIRPNYHFFFVQIDTVTGQRFTGRTISFHSHNNGHVAIDGKRRKPKNDRALLVGQAAGQSQDGHAQSPSQPQGQQLATFKQEAFQTAGAQLASGLAASTAASSTTYSSTSSSSSSASTFGGQGYFRMAFKGQHHPQQQQLSSTSPLGSTSSPSLSSNSLSPSGSLSSISASSSSSSVSTPSSSPPMTIPQGHALPAPSSSSSSPSLSSSPSSSSTAGNLHNSTPIAASTCSVPSPRPSSPSSTFLLPHFSASSFGFPTAPSPPTSSPSPFPNASSPTFAGFPPSISPLNFSAASSFAALSSGSLQPRQVSGLDGRKFEPCVSPPVSFDGEHPLSSFPSWAWPTASLSLSPRSKGRPDSPISGPRTSSPALLTGLAPRSPLPSLSPSSAGALLPSFIGAGSRRRAQATANMHTIGSQSVESLSELAEPTAVDVSAMRLGFPQPPSRTPSPGTADVFGGLSSLLPEPPGFWVTGDRPFGGKRTERDRITPSTPEKRPRST